MSDALVEAMAHLNTLDDLYAQQRQRAIAYLHLLILHRRPIGEHDELRNLVNQHIQNPSDREELVNMSQTMADHLIEQGETRGKRAAIVTTLRTRFNDVPESVIHQIGLIRSFSRLDALFERAVTAQMLDEFDLQ